MGLDVRKPIFVAKVCEQKSVDQPAHPRSLISAFVIRSSESIMFKLATSESIDLILNVGGWVVRWVGFEGVPSSTRAQREGFLNITYI